VPARCDDTPHHHVSRVGRKPCRLDCRLNGLEPRGIATLTRGRRVSNRHYGTPNNQGKNKLNLAGRYHEGTTGH
jgi:hypothetical protein